MMETPTARGYLPIDGIAAYDAAVKGLVFGADSEAVKSGRVATVQAIGGTGGLKIGADFLKKLSPNAKVLISDPSWENHRALFTNAGFVVESYPYYDAAKRRINFDGMLASAERGAPRHHRRAARLLPQPHRLRHHPRAVGPGHRHRQGANLTPFLDMAYQGFGHGIKPKTAR
jgi:aromatic-amino-acid transaminase